MLPQQTIPKESVSATNPECTNPTTLLFSVWQTRFKRRGWAAEQRTLTIDEFTLANWIYSRSLGEDFSLDRDRG